MADFRGKTGCILKDNPSFCDWSDKAMDLLNSEEPEDRLDICNLCQTRDLLKTISYGFKKMNEK